MSSTNRSEARKEHISDYYITPQKQIELFLKEFEKDCDVFKNPNVKISGVEFYQDENILIKNGGV